MWVIRVSIIRKQNVIFLIKWETRVALIFKRIANRLFHCRAFIFKYILQYVIFLIRNQLILWIFHLRWEIRMSTVNKKNFCNDRIIFDMNLAQYNFYNEVIWVNKTFDSGWLEWNFHAVQLSNWIVSDCFIFSHAFY